MTKRIHKKKMRCSSSTRLMIKQLIEQYKLDSGNDCTKLLINKYMHEENHAEHSQKLFGAFVKELSRYVEQFSNSVFLKLKLGKLQKQNFSQEEFFEKYKLNGLDDELTMRLTDDQMDFIDKDCKQQNINFTTLVNFMLNYELYILTWNESIYDLVISLLQSVREDVRSRQNSFGERRDKTQFFNQHIFPAYSALHDELKKTKKSI